MRVGCGWFRSLVTIVWGLLLVATVMEAHPVGNPHAVETMRQIPQWHCLRYRRFDLVKRCRNYRVGRKH